MSKQTNSKTTKTTKNNQNNQTKGKMENAQVKVNEATDNRLERFTDEKLAAELKSRGFEVWKWRDWGEWGTDYWIW